VQNYFPLHLGYYPYGWYSHSRYTSPRFWSCLCLWTGATSGAVVHPPVDIWAWWVTVKRYWQEKSEELGQKPVSVPLCLPQMTHGVYTARTRASAMRGRPAWAMATHDLVHSSKMKFGQPCVCNFYFSDIPILISSCVVFRLHAVTAFEKQLRPWAARAGPQTK
jgi:hypothetical protein